jgi:endonuclease/exonuclease/phosphatase family metal-dependent hydrolase
MNYVDPRAPRYVGGTASTAAAPDTLKLVSLNVEYADSIDAVIRLFSTHPDLSDADLIFLQEMDEPGTSRIARALGLTFVYYPALRWNDERGDFGNAILSRWPIEADEKLILPNLGIFNQAQRIATAATIRVGPLPVRVYSTHLGTPINLRSSERLAQLRAITDDARSYERVVIAGDMNDEHVGDLALERGYLWPTRGGPKTVELFGIWIAAWDHIFLKGLTTPEAGSAGVVRETGRISDHRPIWALAVVR